MRAEFVGLYPTTDTPTQYVDKLYAHAGVSPGTPQERTDAIGEFGMRPRPVILGYADGHCCELLRTPHSSSARSIGRSYRCSISATCGGIRTMHLTRTLAVTTSG
jgi:hypothetical protein